MKCKVLLLGLGLSLSVVAAPVLAERPVVDPTRPPSRLFNTGTVVQNNLPRMRLQSIWYQEGRARAHIDGEIYRVGDSIGQWQIKNISASEVMLTHGNEKLMLTVFERKQMTISRGNE